MTIAVWVPISLAPRRSSKELRVGLRCGWRGTALFVGDHSRESAAFSAWAQIADALWVTDHLGQLFFGRVLRLPSRLRGQLLTWQHFGTPSHETGSSR